MSSDESGVARGGFAGRYGLLLATLLLAVLPVLLVRYPPVTDLPQVVGQIRLLTETVGNPESPYEIDLVAPNRLAYCLAAVGWIFGGAEHGGSIALILLFSIWILAVHRFATSRRRSAAVAALVTILLFGHVLYWGFLGFLIGMPCFLLWVWITLRPLPDGVTLREGLILLGGALLLYEAHILWLLMGGLWLLLEGWVSRRSKALTLRRLLVLSPIALLVSSWYLRFSISGFTSETRMQVSPWERLTYRDLTNSTFGGLHGWLEPLLLGILIAWLGLGFWRVWRARGEARPVEERIDRALLAAGLLLFLAALLLPQKHTNTIYLGSRWMAPAWVFVLLAVPPPLRRPGLRRGAALLVVGLLSIKTSMTWVDFQRYELTGLDDAFAALPMEPRLLTLDFVRKSYRIKPQPYFQLPGYVLARKGGTLNFSFSQFANSLVVRKEQKPFPWSLGLEWFPRLLHPRDLQYFDYVLVHGPSAVHQELESKGDLEVLTRAPLWRLYEVNRGASGSAPPPSP